MYDYVVINDDLPDAVRDFAEIVDAAQLAASGRELTPEESAHIKNLKEKSAALKAAVKKEFLL